MRALFHRLLERPFWLVVLAFACLGISGKLLAGHASLVSEVRDVSLPLAERIPLLEQRVAILREQAELSELHAALRVGSQEEQVHVYALPEQTDLERLVALFTAFHERMRRANLSTDLSAITLGETQPRENGLGVQPLRLEMTLHRDALEQLFALIELSGLLTVGDALTAEERAMLLSQTENENPAGIVALEQFLATPLLHYILEPRPAEDSLLRSFSGPAFEQTLRSVTQGSLIRDARRLFADGFGRELEAKKLWPAQLMTVRLSTLEPGASEGWYTAALELDLWLRR